MKIIVVDNYDELSRVSAEIVAEIVENKPNATLGLATGSTPIGCYDLLSKFCKEKRLSFRNVKTVNLDEYVGLGLDDSQSYAYFMRNYLFDRVDINIENTHIPNGLADDLDEECLRYSDMLSSTVVDVQILGLGSNGHIGFNEPNTPFESVTHVADLLESTIKDNSRLFDSISQVPHRAITMGISEILKAKKIILMASGESKAQAVLNTVRGKMSNNCPASILQSHHNCVVIIDKAAAKLL